MADENQNDGIEVQELKQKNSNEYDILNDRYMRVLAEFENYKKRNSKEKEMLYSNVTADVILSLLPVLDNIENALCHKSQDEEFQKGIELIYKQLQNVLEQKGVEVIKTKDEKFDPELHEAISLVDNPDYDSQMIVEEMRKGYKIGDKVIRHSMVVVAN